MGVMDSTRDDKIKQKEVIMKETKSFFTVVLQLLFISLATQILFNLTPVQSCVYAFFTFWFWTIVKMKNKLKGDGKSEKKLDD